MNRRSFIKTSAAIVPAAMTLALLGKDRNSEFEADDGEWYTFSATIRAVGPVEVQPSLLVHGGGTVELSSMSLSPTRA